MSTPRPAPPRAIRLTLTALFALGLVACDRDGDGSRRRYDCDDFDPDRYPGNREVCDGIDNDCDFDVDEHLTETWYPDRDGDGVGVTSGRVEQCGRPIGYADRAGDCDDDDRRVYPGAEERCDGQDNDCDGFVDVDGVYTTLYYPDLDDDGHGDRYSREVSCLAVDGWVTSSDDCDDDDDAIHPGADEVCDGEDNDCNGAVDDVPEGC